VLSKSTKGAQIVAFKEIEKELSCVKFLDGFQKKQILCGKRKWRDIRKAMTETLNLRGDSYVCKRPTFYSTDSERFLQLLFEKRRFSHLAHEVIDITL
jgi:hypothetical protein